MEKHGAYGQLTENNSFVAVNQPPLYSQKAAKEGYFATQ